MGLKNLRGFRPEPLNNTKPAKERDSNGIDVLKNLLVRRHLALAGLKTGSGIGAGKDNNSIGRPLATTYAASVMMNPNPWNRQLR